MVLSLTLDRPSGDGAIVAFVTALGMALGLQNATARTLAVPDLTTTVLTLTITGIACDSKAAGGSDSMLGRRLVPVVTMFLGGLLGATLTVREHGSIDLTIATAVLTAVVVAASFSARSQAEWTTKR